MSILQKIAEKISAQLRIGFDRRRAHFDKDSAAVGQTPRFVLGIMLFAITLAFSSLIIENYSFTAFLKSRADRVHLLEATSSASEAHSLSFRTVSGQAPIYSQATDRLYLPITLTGSAVIQVNGQQSGNCIAGIPCMVPIQGKTAPFDVGIQSLESDGLVKLSPNSTAFVSDQRTMREAQTLLEKTKNEENRRISVYARILLSIFCIIIYFSIERSPETLGLALFSGLESVALLFGFNGILPPILPSGISYVLPKHFCWGLADFFRLYFTIQICRVGRSSISQWFKIGVPVCLVYGFVRYGQYHYGWAWAAKTWAYKDFTFGSLAVALTATSFVQLVSARLHRRALIVGFVGLATIPEVGVAAADLFLNPDSLGYLSTVFTLLESNSVFILAICTLLNISDLESKLKTMMEQRKIDFKNEKELEVARNVQQSLLLPPFSNENTAFRMIYHPASYVSGDMYFAKWDEQQGTGVLILYDVVGHGVQAALKAASAFAIADTLWNGDEPNPGIRRSVSRRSDGRRIEDSRLVRFERMVQKHLLSRGNGDDFCAMVAVEFDLRAGQICVYRANYNNPLLIERTPTGTTVQQLVIPNRTLTWFDVKEGSRIILASDGLMTSSRVERQLIRDISRLLPITLDQHSSILDAVRLAGKKSFETNLDDITVLEITIKKMLSATHLSEKSNSDESIAALAS